ncbi:uncharacterized protein LOC143625314 [Bidens hawaiensis]|uniref:uncharacterized protein LOC143625314 n=1 Tax=Bidens hawaiensis TaxID=980011 RepID=UPI00404B8218
MAELTLYDNQIRSQPSGQQRNDLSKFIKEQAEKGFPFLQQRKREIRSQMEREKRNKRINEVHISKLSLFEMKKRKSQASSSLGKRKTLKECLAVREVMLEPNSSTIYRLEEIADATENFSDANLITEGTLLGKVYKGRLIKDGNFMTIAIRRLDREIEQGDELQKEISMLNRFKNKNNIVSVVGYCDENNEKIIIYEHAFNGTLDKHLSDGTLTWSQRLRICLGVARALSCIHYDVVHCDISSSKIFLDKDWEPKIYGFEISTEYPPSWRHRLLCANVRTPKYDVYCLGLLLFEVLCGRKPMIMYDVVHEEPAKIIDPNLRKHVDKNSFKLFINVANDCLKGRLITMDQIVKELEEVLEVQRSSNLIEHSIAAVGTPVIKSMMMDFLNIPLSKIKDATKNFTETFVGSGGFGEVYKAELDVLNIKSLSSMKGKRKYEMPKVRKTVAIKRLFNNKADEQAKQGFLTEIELLSSCSHANVVSLLGFCEEGGEMIIVYEYASGGSLSDYLESSGKLTWAQRIQICLDIAHGINYLHTIMEEKPMIIHRDIKSDNILLDGNLNAKVADFGLSKFHLMKQQVSTVKTMCIAGTQFYLDPEFSAHGKYKRASDIYSFGVVLFEVLSGRLAYDSIYFRENNMGLAPIARKLFIEGTLKELMDPKMIEDDDHILTLNRGPNKKSFETFSKIAYECLAETQVRRPTMEVIIYELQYALHLQGGTNELSRFQLNDILSATNEFDETYRIGVDTNSVVYKAELDHYDKNSFLITKGENNGEPSKKRSAVAIKRISGRKGLQVKQGFFAELERGATYKHPKIVSLLGFCDAGDEMILVYEHHSSNKRLNEYLKSADSMNNLTWTHRLHMCLDIARGIKYLHTNTAIHSDIKSASIVLDENFHAKIASFGISMLHPINQEVCLKVYEDPEYETTGNVEINSDIYSFGVVLFETFCGRLAYDPIYIEVNGKGLAPIAHQCFKDGTIERMIDPKLKEETNEDVFTSTGRPTQYSLDTFLKIAYRCLGAATERPTIEIVIKELERALVFQGETFLRRFPLDDIMLATENFDETCLIGADRNGMVYKAELDHFGKSKSLLTKGMNNGETSIKRITVAIKRITDTKDSQVKQRFYAELERGATHKHPKIASLLGFCDAGDEMILVYEHHASNKSLDEYLKSIDSINNLTWTHRLHMCLEIARIIKYLHGNMSNHGDLKSANILLDMKCEPKIAYYGISKLHPPNQEIGMKVEVYEDPEYEATSKVETKSDIYSFGVVLFEIFCGRSAYDQVYAEVNDKGLAPLVCQCFKDGTIKRMIDPKLLEESDEDIFISTKGPNQESLHTFLRIAYRCLGEAARRPTIEIVINELDRALNFQIFGAVDNM